MSSDIQAHLDAELAWLRLLLERRALWLRGLWKADRDDASPATISDHEADLACSGALGAACEYRFYAEDPAALAIGERIVATRQAADSLRLPDLPVARVASRFRLMPFEQAALLACVAPELDASISVAYGYVQDDGRRRYPTAHLLVALLAEPEAALRAAAQLGAGGTLRRFRLIEADDRADGSPAASQPLVAAAHVTQYLTGCEEQDPGLAYLLRPADEAPPDPWVQRAAEMLLTSARAESRINLTGPAHAGKELIAAAAARQCGRRLNVLEIGRLPGGEIERQPFYRLLEREARLASLAYFLPRREEESLARLTVEIADVLDAPLFLDTRERSDARGLCVVAVLPPDRAEQIAIWRRALDTVPNSVNGQLGGLVQQFDLGPADIREAVDEASRQGPVDGSALWHICRKQRGWQLEELARRITPRYHWSDLVLDPDALGQLHEIAAQVAQRARVYEEWGFARQLSSARGISALFAGPSGTGKTMAAEIIACELQLDLYVIDLAGIVSKYIGETEKNLRRVFDTAEESGAILFFDEADALFGKRSEVKDSHDRYANIEVNYLLQKMERYQGLAILSTNRRAALDRAFLRRLRFLVDFPFPDRANRERIWRKMFPADAPIDDLDFGQLARMELTGGNIRTIALNAAFLASAGGEAIRMDHLMRAARQEYAKIDKLVTEAEFGSHYREAR